MREILTRQSAVPTSKGLALGMRIEWDSGSMVFLTAPKGWMGCGIFDIEAANMWNQAVCLVESWPGFEVGPVERLITRKIMAVNERAATLGITVGMEAMEALELMF